MNSSLRSRRTLLSLALLLIFAEPLAAGAATRSHAGARARRGSVATMPANDDAVRALRPLQVSRERVLTLAAEVRRIFPADAGAYDRTRELYGVVAGSLSRFGDVLRREANAGRSGRSTLDERKTAALNSALAAYDGYVGRLPNLRRARVPGVDPAILARVRDLGGSSPANRTALLGAIRAYTTLPAFGAPASRR